MIIYVSVVFVFSLSLCTVSRSFKSVKTVVNENYLPLWVKLKCFSTIQIWKITWYYSWNSKSSNHKLCMVNWFPQWHNLHLNSLNVGVLIACNRSIITNTFRPCLYRKCILATLGRVSSEFLLMAIGRWMEVERFEDAVNQNCRIQLTNNLRKLERSYWKCRGKLNKAR